MDNDLNLKIISQVPINNSSIEPKRKDLLNLKIIPGELPCVKLSTLCREKHVSFQHWSDNSFFSELAPLLTLQYGGSAVIIKDNSPRKTLGIIMQFIKMNGKTSKDTPQVKVKVRTKHAIRIESIEALYSIDYARVIPPGTTLILRYYALPFPNAEEEILMKSSINTPPLPCNETNETTQQVLYSIFPASIVDG